MVFGVRQIEKQAEPGVAQFCCSSPLLAPGIEWGALAVLNAVLCSDRLPVSLCPDALLDVTQTLQHVPQLWLA